MFCHKSTRTFTQTNFMLRQKYDTNTLLTVWGCHFRGSINVIQTNQCDQDLQAYKYTKKKNGRDLV